MAEGTRVFSDAREGSPSGCKKLEGKSNEVLLPHYPYMKDTVYEYGESGAPYNRAGKAVAYFQKNTGTLAKQFNKKDLKDALKNYLPEKIRDNVIDAILNYVKKSLED